jgi:ABC-type nitrate/sulfonate/bicarbonate transport system ATPase subunit
MMQRAALARALANDPAILLMDEPFGALDSQTRSLMQELLLDIWQASHKTVLFITHDIDESILLGDRVYVMTARPGRIREMVQNELPRPRTWKQTFSIRRIGGVLERGGEGSAVGRDRCGRWQGSVGGSASSDIREPAV